MKLDMLNTRHLNWLDDRSPLSSAMGREASSWLVGPDPQ